ncbi:type II secretion system protein GspK [Yersinia sp. 2105 StPb PI]|uniref:type II secretion system protein GspK n=1 Tax=Yersinia TaxID=629 RepID=UPI000FFCABEA|nr:type II secretion system protein GspK [Yersinia sp. 2105 StPb PI]RXA95238.1 hypothetical protein EQP49_14930 [Yersinia sp. 2105 StPb PI]
MRQRGIALLLVLCILFLMSIIAMTSSLYLSELYYLTERLKKKKYERWLLLGVEGIFLDYIVKNISNDNVIHSSPINSFFFSELKKINNINADFKLIEQSNCFNLNLLKYSPIDGNAIDGIYPWLVFKNILQSQNLKYSTLNKITHHIDEGFKNKYPLDEGYINSIVNVNKKPLSYDLVFSLFENEEDLSNMSSILCSRSDSTLLININMLELRHGSLLKAIFLNKIDEEEIANAILAKPDGGWDSTIDFFELIINNSTKNTSELQRIKDTITPILSHDEYYFSIIFTLPSKDSHYQLMSLFYVKNRDAFIIDRRFNIRDESNE